ncbi:hypothetical protein MKW92_014621 [Papaver armeniacum]|nr:hypothetical protein MKW92_014621 [Papaver armeniacum]
MSILIYLMTAINISFFLLTKHPLFLRSLGTMIGAFWGRPMWGTFWVLDARLIYQGALHFQKLSVELAFIPIIKFSINCRSGTSIHVFMLIPILSNFANSPCFTLFFFVLETRF